MYIHIHTISNTGLPRQLHAAAEVIRIHMYIIYINHNNTTTTNTNDDTNNHNDDNNT